MFTALQNKQNPAALQAQLSTQLELYTALNTKALETIGKVVELNMQLMQQTLAHAAAEVQPATSAGNPLAALWSAPAANQGLAYSRHLAHILIDAGTEYLRLMQPSITRTEQQFTAQLEGLARQSPARGSSLLDMLRSAMGQANNSYDNLIKVSEQASEALSNGYDGAASAAAPKAAKGSRRAPAK